MASNKAARTKPTRAASELPSSTFAGHGWHDDPSEKRVKFAAHREHNGPSCPRAHPPVPALLDPLHPTLFGQGSTSREPLSARKNGEGVI